MIRRILVALDGSAASAVAQATAIDIARRRDAEVTGIAVADRSPRPAPPRSARAPTRSIAIG